MRIKDFFILDNEETLHIVVREEITPKELHATAKKSVEIVRESGGNPKKLKIWPLGKK